MPIGAEPAGVQSGPVRNIFYVLARLPMTKLTLPYRRATADDAAALAALVDIAGEGLPMYLWTKMAGPGETPSEVGRQRARRENGSFSFRNAVVREENGRIAACLIGYPLPDVPEPIDYDELPAMFVPLQELENLAPRTWYVNVLATFPAHRGKGYGTDFLAIADELAIATGRAGTSLIVSEANVGARRLYERRGYVERATRPMIKESWKHAGDNWVLLVKGMDPQTQE